MNAPAKRVDNLTPRDARLTFADGSTVTVAGRESDDGWSTPGEVTTVVRAERG